MQHSVRQTLIFAFALCVVCSVLVSASAVGLRDRQEQNKLLDEQKNVLEVAGLIEVGAQLDVDRAFDGFSPQPVRRM